MHPIVGLLLLNAVVLIVIFLLSKKASRKPPVDSTLIIRRIRENPETVHTCTFSVNDPFSLTVELNDESTHYLSGSADALMLWDELKVIAPSAQFIITENSRIVCRNGVPVTSLMR